MLKQFEKGIYLPPEFFFLTVNFFGEVGLTSDRNGTSVTTRVIETTGLARLGDLLELLPAVPDGPDPVRIGVGVTNLAGVWTTPGPVGIGEGVANLGGLRTTFELDDLGLACKDTHNLSSSVTVQV